MTCHSSSVANCFIHCFISIIINFKTFPLVWQTVLSEVLVFLLIFFPRATNKGSLVSKPGQHEKTNKTRTSTFWETSTIAFMFYFLITTDQQHTFHLETKESFSFYSCSFHAGGTFLCLCFLHFETWRRRTQPWFIISAKYDKQISHDCVNNINTIFKVQELFALTLVHNSGENKPWNNHHRKKKHQVTNTLSSSLFHFLHISKPFSSYSRRDMTWFAVMWTMRALVHNFSRFSFNLIENANSRLNSGQLTNIYQARRIGLIKQWWQRGKVPL